MLKFHELECNEYIAIIDSQMVRFKTVKKNVSSSADILGIDFISMAYLVAQVIRQDEEVSYISIKNKVCPAGDFYTVCEAVLTCAKSVGFVERFEVTSD